MGGAILFGNPPIEVRVRRNAAARRMVLRVTRAGRGTVLTLPQGVPLSTARAFLQDHESWLRRQLAAQTALIPVRDGLVLPFQDARLMIRADTGRRLVREGDVLRVPGPAADVPRKVAAYLRNAARDACVEASDRHAARLGLRPGPIRLRDPASRWGSCSSTGALMYSWRLILAPTAILDYVAAHEVAHLVEMNHSDRFWRLVDLLYPDHATARDWLRREGAGLHAYDFGGEEAA